MLLVNLDLKRSLEHACLFDDNIHTFAVFQVLGCQAIIELLTVSSSCLRADNFLRFFGSVVSVVELSIIPPIQNLPALLSNGRDQR
jgi:hypothetical protein